MLLSKGKMKGGLGYLKEISNEYQANLVLIRIGWNHGKPPFPIPGGENLITFSRLGNPIPSSRVGKPRYVYPGLNTHSFALVPGLKTPGYKHRDP